MSDGTRDEARHSLLSKSLKESANIQKTYTIDERLRRLRLWTGAWMAISLILAIALTHSIMKSHNSTLDETDTGWPNPPIFKETVTFQRNDQFAAPPSLQSDDAWGASMLAVENDGFVFLSPAEREKLKLPPGIQSRGGQLYDISLFHQMHCLIHIRTYISTLRSALGSNNSQSVVDLLRPSEEHVYHCFDYIRQSLMCAGDMTVEPPREEPDGKRFAVDGWGIEHTCKSWKAILEVMAKHSKARS